MSMDFKSFYFLHIPKTGGRIFRVNVVDQVYRDIKNSHVRPIYSKLTVHQDWDNRFDPDEINFDEI